MGINAGTFANMNWGQSAQIAGAGVSAIGAYSSAKSQQLALSGAADIADINAGLSEQAAQQELARGGAAVASASARAGQVKSSQRAAMAANGVDLGEGSAAEVLASTDLYKEGDINTLTANAVRAAWGQRVQATNYKNEASSKRAGADSISPVMAGATSLLGSAGTIANSWYSLKKGGAGSMPNAQNVAPRGT